ncbi:hypothetical protein P875_00011134 [Aspergillus parasiticus SU-1]|uniref:Uncharacterized protein n=1 Tax=Aspergillus parasiticus (strain ATCC 56775 / NRRL 5862 / SRRC 143 / SU-1) TaxID=1403190 RepID=A0A0F0IC01_ASPPU|nr:hypothetical protein P875_00011134 [Aspergillus parasiticus SU-1]
MTFVRSTPIQRNESIRLRNGAHRLDISRLTSNFGTSSTRRLEVCAFHLFWSTATCVTGPGAAAFNFAGNALVAGSLGEFRAHGVRMENGMGDDVWQVYAERVLQ